MDKLASEYKVLIVDDVPTNVMLVQAILKKRGIYAFDLRQRDKSATHS